MQRGDERFKLLLAEELHLIDQQHDSPTGGLRRFTDSDEEIGEVAAKIASVTEAGLCLNIETGR